METQDEHTVVGSPQSRAVVREIQPGTLTTCAGCGESIGFRAAARPREVICNVYLDGAWTRVEHYHPLCYEVAGEPYGPPDTSNPRLRRPRR